MSSSFKSAVSIAADILRLYHEKHGAAPFPVIKGKLFPLIEARAGSRGVDNLYVKRFKESVSPIGGQMRRIEESNGSYLPVEQHGVIYLCPSLNLDWQRFILVKEAAHLILDDPEEYVHVATDLDKLMVCLAQFGAEAVTKSYVSEMRAICFAIELLFPRVTRSELAEQYSAGRIAPAAIAKAARIPEHFVQLGMSGSYIEMVDEIIASDDGEREAAE